MNEKRDLLTLTTDNCRIWDETNDKYQMCVNKRGETLNSVTVNISKSSDVISFLDISDSVNMACSKLIFMQKIYRQIQANAPQHYLEMFEKYISGELYIDKMPDELFFKFLQFAIEK